jgi:hypothetical protein
MNAELHAAILRKRSAFDCAHDRANHARQRREAIHAMTFGLGLSDELRSALREAYHIASREDAAAERALWAADAALAEAIATACGTL